jgi:hypothetical protein
MPGFDLMSGQAARAARRPRANDQRDDVVDPFGTLPGRTSNRDRARSVPGPAPEDCMQLQTSKNLGKEGAI